MELTLKRKSNKQSTLMSQYAEEDWENYREIDSPLKEIDFSSNHTEDKSLFDVILNNNSPNEDEVHQNVAPNKKRGRKKKIGAQAYPAHLLQTAQILKSHLPPDHKLNSIQIQSTLFRTQHECFLSFEIRKHYQQSEVEKESVENQSLQKSKQDLSQNQTKKGKTRTKRKLISTKRRLKSRVKDPILRHDRPTNSAQPKTGFYQNDNFQQYLNL